MTAVHAYQLDFTSLTARSAHFGTTPRDILSSRSDGHHADPSTPQSARSVASEPTPRTLLGPDYDGPLRKHTYHASLSTSGRRSLRPAPCPVHSYSGTPSTLGRQSAPFGRAARPAALPPLPSGAGASTTLGPDFDKALKPGTFSARFSGVPRQLGTESDGAPVHAYTTPSPFAKKAPKATFGTESRFGSETAVSAPVHAHHTPSPFAKKAPKATFGTASRFGSGPCKSDATATRRLAPPRSRPLTSAAVHVNEPQQLQPTPPPPTKVLDEILVPTAAEVKDLEPSLPLSARLSVVAPSPWRHALPLPEILPAEVAGAA